MRKRMPVTGWGPPLGALIALAFGQRDAAMTLMMCVWIANILSFSSFDALRRAVAGVFSDKDMGKMLRSALLLVLCGGAWWYRTSNRYDLVFSFAALILTALRCMQAILEAKGDRVSLILTDMIAAIGLAATLLSAPSAWEREIACAVAAGVPALIATAFILPILFGGWGLSGRFFKEALLTLLRNLIWPVLALALDVGTDTAMVSHNDTGIAAGFITGCLIMEWTRPLFRRRDGEGAFARLTVAAGSAILSAIGLVLVKCKVIQDDFVEALIVMILLAGGCALWVYEPVNWRNILSGALLILPAAALVANAQLLNLLDYWEIPEIWVLSGCALAGILSCILMIPDWALTARRIRAERIRRRARRISRHL